MSIVNILTRKAPTIATYEFDAVLEDTLEISNDVTGYPIELGARASDHVITNPFRYTLTVAVSNNPLRVQVSDFIGAASYADTDSGLLATAAGLSAGFLAGSSETRASSALSFLIELATTKQRFDISTGEIDLTDLVVRKITRQKTPDTENTMVAVVELEQLATLSTVIALNQPQLSQLNENDPSYTSNAAVVNKGDVVGGEPSGSVTDEVNGVI